MARRPPPASHGSGAGADDQDRTGDLVLTKDALCQLSYIGLLDRVIWSIGSLHAQLGQLNDPMTEIDPIHGSNWSGRRGSNPRPTAWKAVTLPLSYSRSRSGHWSIWSLGHWVIRLSDAQPDPDHPPTRTPRSPSLVAREGLEPSKPLGRQIYSLLRLTASLPRQLSVVLDAVRSTRALRTGTTRLWSWRRDLNPRPADYKSAALPTELRQPRQKWDYSTSCASRAIPLERAHRHSTDELCRPRCAA